MSKPKTLDAIQIINPNAKGSFKAPKYKETHKPREISVLVSKGGGK